MFIFSTKKIKFLQREHFNFILHKKIDNLTFDYKLFIFNFFLHKGHFLFFLNQGKIQF